MRLSAKQSASVAAASTVGGFVCVTKHVYRWQRVCPRYHDHSSPRLPLPSGRSCRTSVGRGEVGVGACHPRCTSKGENAVSYERQRLAYEIGAGDSEFTVGAREGVVSVRGGQLGSKSEAESLRIKELYFSLG